MSKENTNPDSISAEITRALDKYFFEEKLRQTSRRAEMGSLSEDDFAFLNDSIAAL